MILTTIVPTVLVRVPLWECMSENATIVFSASDDSSYVNGIELFVDSGYAQQIDEQRRNS